MSARWCWLAALAGFGLILARNEIRQTIVDRAQVVIVYDFVTDTPVGVVPCVELLELDESSPEPESRPPVRRPRCTCRCRGTWGR